MSLKQLSEDVSKWQERNFPQAEKWEPLVGMQEELGELSHAFLKQHQNIRKDEDHRAKMCDAIGDIVIYMIHFCELNGIDMEAEIERTWRTVRQRDWTATSLQRPVQKGQE